MVEGEEAKQLAYVPEVILKKRKHKEDSIALTRKTQLELGRYGANNKRKVEEIKRPEQFVKEFRDKVYIIIDFTFAFYYVYIIIINIHS